MCCAAGWCQNWVSGSGRSGSGFQRAWAGPTWRTGTDEYTPKPATCGWRCLLRLYFLLFVKSLKGQFISHTRMLIHEPFLFVTGDKFMHLYPSIFRHFFSNSLDSCVCPFDCYLLCFSSPFLLQPVITFYSWIRFIFCSTSQQLLDIHYSVTYFMIHKNPFLQVTHIVSDTSTALVLPVAFSNEKLVHGYFTAKNLSSLVIVVVFHLPV